ncbi:MAG: MarR family transcriptional regulator [Pseudonocardiales bacterium]|nr:MarR family transcriptional regulator [Pseudonocardiales bacterium]
MTTSPLSTPLADRVSFLISQLGFHAAACFTERLRPLGLHPRHFGLLSHLSVADGQTQQRLATAMAIHRNVMVGLVDDLEDRGLVQRRRHPSDRRAHAVHLTAAARDLLIQAQRAADEHEAELLAGLDEPDRRQLVSLLQHLAQHAGLAPGVHPGLHQSRASSAPRFVAGKGFAEASSDVVAP